MTIRLDLKPSRFGSKPLPAGKNPYFSNNYYRTKFEIEGAINRSYGSRWDKDYEIGVNYQKHNPVHKQIKFKNGKTKKTALITPGYWVAWVYKIPKSWPVKVIQHSRHFTIENK